MKTKTFSRFSGAGLVGALLLLPAFLFGGCQSAAASLKAVDRSAIESVIREFAAAGDAQNADRADAVIDTSFRVVALDYPQTGDVSTLSRADYLGLLRAKKLGGTERKVQVNHISASTDKLASATVEMHSSALRMFNSMTLAKIGGEWKLVHDVAAVKPAQ